MARGVNKVILIGNLGRDPEVRYMPSGAAFATVTLATTEMWKDKQTGENQERTEWHRIVFYQRLAEIVGEYLRKGSKVFVEGRLRTSKWQDKNTGQDRYTTEIVADNMQMLDSKGSGSSLGAANQFNDPQSSYEPRPMAASGGGGNGGNGGGVSSSVGGGAGHIASGGAEPAMDNFDDEIPF